MAPRSPARSAGPKPLRADAQRNRDRLIEIAAAAFTDDGVDVSLEDIARRAGVGIGTLYRHFPTREALVLAVYRSLIDDLRQAAHELPTQYPPAEALHEWMRSFVRYAAVKRGMVALLRSMMEVETELFDEAREVIRSSAQSLLDAAVADGSIRGHVNAPDLVRAMGGICMVTDPARHRPIGDGPGGPGFRRPPVRRRGRLSRRHPRPSRTPFKGSVPAH